MQGRADVHVHTKYSGVSEYGMLRFPESISNPEDVVKIAKQTGLNVVCITDHNSITGAVKASKFASTYDGVQVVVGEEITTADGEVIGLFLNEEVPMGLSAAETIDIIRSQGGLVVAPHPFSYHVPAVGRLLDKLDIDGIEVINGGHIDGPSNERAMEFASQGRWAKVAGSDAHSLSQIGCAHTLFEGTTSEDFYRSLKNGTTDVYGHVMPLHLGVKWSIGIVLASDKYMIQSLLGLLEGDETDPLVRSIRQMRPDQQLVALLGSIIFLTPPIPFLAGLASKALMRKKNEIHTKVDKFKRMMDRKSRLNPVDVDVHGPDPLDSQKP